ncbi:MAG: hypothetical protein ACD_75C01945G0002 [uncultured bacterium]|nr:MAG: hypothetical protein ACD_75C01945G0002 [uncultured bacterium]
MMLSTSFDKRGATISTRRLWHCSLLLLRILIRNLREIGRKKMGAQKFDVRL